MLYAAVRVLSVVPWRRANRITLPRMSIFHTIPSGFLYGFFSSFSSSFLCCPSFTLVPFLSLYLSHSFARARFLSINVSLFRARTGSIRFDLMPLNVRHTNTHMSPGSTVCAYFALLFRSFFHSFFRINTLISIHSEPVTLSPQADEALGCLSNALKLFTSFSS